MEMAQEKPMIQIQNASSNRILRSPSHESISTEISLLSLSSMGQFARIPSPIPDTRYRLTVPNSADGSKNTDFWVDEENDLIQNFGALFKILGKLPKSFSTSDISSSTIKQVEDTGQPGSLRKSISELDLTQIGCSEAIFRNHFGPTSRSCSTWVAVGDVSSNSQLPSPQGRPNFAANGGSFSPADLVRSMNKKIRQMYIRKRLLLAYRALERLAQNDFDLEKLSVVMPIKSLISGSAGLGLPSHKEISIPVPQQQVNKVTTLVNNNNTANTTTTPLTTTEDSEKDKDKEKYGEKKKTLKEIPLTLKDVERERGQPLSKFERNMMIFNWLHTLDEGSYEQVIE